MHRGGGSHSRTGAQGAPPRRATARQKIKPNPGGIQEWPRCNAPIAPRSARHKARRLRRFLNRMALERCGAFYNNLDEQDRKRSPERIGKTNSRSQAQAYSRPLI
jgi:hypothetical protein